MGIWRSWRRHCVKLHGNSATVLSPHPAKDQVAPGLCIIRRQDLGIFEERWTKSSTSRIHVGLELEPSIDEGRIERPRTEFMVTEAHISSGLERSAERACSTRFESVDGTGDKESKHGTASSPSQGFVVRPRDIRKLYRIEGCEQSRRRQISGVR